MIHLDEKLMGPLCKATGALALASALALAGCGGGGAQSNAAPSTLFAANDGGGGIELWKTDGTANGTSLVKDINLGAGNSFPGGSGLFPSEFVFFNGAWFFSADDGMSGTELWKSDGTPGGTVQVKDINSTSSGASSSPRGFTVFNNALYFSADDGGNGRELWKTDGTPGGTRLVMDIAPGMGLVGGIPGPLSSSPSGFTVFNNALYFSADDGVHGFELWKTDAAGITAQVMDINTTSPGANSFPRGFTVFNNALYFSADDGVNGRELWKTDGSGTVQVMDINPQLGDSSPSGLTVFNNALYFSADDGTCACLWKSGGTGVTVRVGAVSLVSGLTVFNNALYFSASDGVAGVELWKTDVNGSTVQVKGINNTTLGAPNAFTILNNALLFSADDGVTGRELWRTDGTGAGTMQVKDICPGNCDGVLFR